MSNILITGGHTEVPIDKVRSISNIFHGKTAMDIADVFYGKHYVVVLGNEAMKHMLAGFDRFIVYKTFDELESKMEEAVKSNQYDCIIHSAAVSDYTVSRVLGPDMQELDNTGKVGSSYDKLYLEMVPTRKIVDQIRGWGFKGILVKFKLQVGISDEELIDIAHRSRLASNANIIVANCLEWAKEKAYILDSYTNMLVKRDQLASALMNFLDVQ
jgi:phosphopantothenoylcysteine synthetase/decarboxylase